MMTAVLIFLAGVIQSAGSEGSMSDSLENGLVARWDLLEDCRDSSGNDLHCEDHGVTWVPGREAAFDGAKSYIEAPGNPRFRFGKDDFSISVCVKGGEEDRKSVV